MPLPEALTEPQREKLERVRRQNRHAEPKNRRRRIAAEFVGTILVTLATLLPDAVERGLGLHVGYVTRASCTGIAMMIAIYTLGEVSGAHTNPITTIAFALRGDFDWSRVPEYVAAQFAGAMCAGWITVGVLGVAPQSLASEQLHGAWAAFGMEIVLTAILVYVALATANHARFIGPQSAIANGATTIFDRLVGYHISGGSMNPARTLGPAIALGTIAASPWWVYVAGPLAGMLAAVILVWYIHGKPNVEESQHSHG